MVGEFRVVLGDPGQPRAIEAVRRIRDAGVALRVAHVEGDNLLGRLFDYVVVDMAKKPTA